MDIEKYSTDNYILDTYMEKYDILDVCGGLRYYRIHLNYGNRTVKMYWEKGLTHNTTRFLSRSETVFLKLQGRLQ